MTLSTVLLAVLVVALLAVVPAWPHSRSWGYWPSGIVGALLVSALLLTLLAAT